MTLALNVPVRKGLRIELWGLDGAQVRFTRFVIISQCQSTNTDTGGLMARKFALLLFTSTKVQILTRGA